MSNATLNGINEQATKLFIDPARAYVGLTVDHFEKLAGAQLDSAKAFADAGLDSARAALGVSDADGLKSYLQGREKAARALGERVKGDTEAVAGLNQQYVENVQKLAQDSVRNLSAAAQAK